MAQDLTRNRAEETFPEIALNWLQSVTYCEVSAAQCPPNSRKDKH